METSRVDKLGEIQERRLIHRILVIISISGLIIGIFFYLSGRKVEKVIKEKKIQKSESKVANLEDEFLKYLAIIDINNLNNEQELNIDGIESLIEGFKGVEVDPLFIDELSIKIEELKKYPKK